MKVICGTGLSMTRGDSEYVLVSCVGRPFADGDVIELTVRRSPGRGPKLIHKSVTEFTDEGKANICFDPEDTSDLDFGTYSYDVQATLTDLGVKTIITPSPFEIREENTYAD